MTTETIYLDDEAGAPTGTEICWHAPADPKIVCRVLAADIDLDGRSEWRWFRLQNGDLIMGVFPRGDTYFTTEADENRP